MTSYVVAGAWVDEEWAKAAAARSTPGPRQEADNERYLSGPRSHPFGFHAYTVVVNGEPRVYPTKDDALADTEAAKVINSAQQTGFKSAVAEPGVPAPLEAPLDDGNPPPQPEHQGA